MKGPIIGIDLGTTNSLIAVWRAADADNSASNAASDTDGNLVDSPAAKPRAELIPNSAGHYLTPSAVSIDEENDGAVLIGDAAAQRRVRHADVTCTEFKRDMGSTRIYRLGNRSFTPEQLSALILTSLKQDAESYLGEPVTQAVISVPAYFNDTQRNATIAAARLADLTVTRLVNEPTAAAIAYGLAVEAEDDAPSSTLVFDLGGGTFDISVVEQFDGVIEIKASTGDNYLGGEDFTQAIAMALAKKLDIPEAQWAILEPGERAHFVGAAERIKHTLTDTNKGEARVLYGGDYHELTFTEKDFEKAVEPLLERIRRPVRMALRDARLEPEKLDNIVLVGGSTRMPIARKLVARLFGRFPETSIDPDKAIAIGAATQAALLARDVTLDEVLLTDVSPFTLGVAISNYNSTGQLVQGVFSPIIERNTIIPASREATYTTVEDNQSEIELEVFQGEHRFVKDNVKLGEISVPIPKKAARKVTIVVRFSYDASGMLEVDVAVDGSEEHVTLTLLGNAARLDEADLAKRKAELAKLKIHPRDDLPNRAVMERADRLYAELTGSNREQIGEAMNDFAAVIESQDTDRISQERTQFEAWLNGVEARL